MSVEEITVADGISIIGEALPEPPFRTQLDENTFTEKLPDDLTQLDSLTQIFLVEACLVIVSRCPVWVVA